MRPHFDTVIHDTCHEKTDLKVFVVVIPKEGLVGCGLQNIIYEGSRVIFYSRCHAQRRIGGAPDIKVCFSVTRHIAMIEHRGK